VVKGFYPIPDDGNPRIPAYIDSIDMRAFRGCTKLKNAVFTDTAVKERIKTLRILIFGKCNQHAANRIQTGKVENFNSIDHSVNECHNRIV
jgi:hypothetical protein